MVWKIRFRCKLLNNRSKGWRFKRHCKENQKSGINKNEISKYVSYCKDIGLDLIGLMCIPPLNIDLEIYFKEMKSLNDAQGFKELSMGMSSDFLTAIKYSATYVRVGSSIFGQRF